MIRFHCGKTPKEHIQTWLEKPRRFNYDLPETFFEVAREAFGVRYVYSNSPNRKYFWRAKRFLKEEIEEGDAVVSLLRSPRFGIVRGSSRIPLKVKTKDRTFIIKPYDDYNPSLERQVLTTVNGIMGPRVLYFGSDFYAEEWIDSGKYANLWEKCIATGAFESEKRLELWDYCFGAKSDDQIRRRKLMGEMVEAAKPFILQGAKLHADLAKLTVVYDHNHWLDEFHVTDDGKPMVTDFGSSRFFLRPEDLAEESRLEAQYKVVFAELRKADIPALRQVQYERKLMGVCMALDSLHQYKEVYDLIQKRGIFDSLTKPLRGQADALDYLRQDLPLAANLITIISSAEKGIKSFFENTAIGSGSNYLQLIQTDFSSVFIQQYFA